MATALDFLHTGAHVPGRRRRTEMELYSASHSQVLQARAEPWGWQQDNTTRSAPTCSSTTRSRRRQPAASDQERNGPTEGWSLDGFRLLHHARRADRPWRGAGRMALAEVQDHDQRMSIPAARARCAGRTSRVYRQDGGRVAIKNRTRRGAPSGKHRPRALSWRRRIFPMNPREPRGNKQLSRQFPFHGN